MFVLGTIVLITMGKLMVKAKLWLVLTDFIVYWEKNIVQDKNLG